MSNQLPESASIPVGLVVEDVKTKTALSERTGNEDERRNA